MSDWKMLSSIGYHAKMEEILLYRLVAFCILPYYVGLPGNLELWKQIEKNYGPVLIHMYYSVDEVNVWGNQN